MSLKLSSSGGGSIDIQAPSTASNVVATLPATTGNLISDNSPATRQLGYAQVTANQGSITTAVDLTGLTTTVTTLTNQKVKITAQVSMTSSVGGDQMALSLLKDGVVVMSAYSNQGSVAAQGQFISLVFVDSPTAGSHTYKLQAFRNIGTGTLTMAAASTFPAFILVEAF